MAGLPCKNEFQVLYKHGPYSSCNIMCWLLCCGVGGTAPSWSRAKCSGQAAHGSLLRAVGEPARHNEQPVCLWSRHSAALTSWKYSKLLFVSQCLASSDMVAKELLATSKADFQVVMTTKQTDGVGLEETSFGSFPMKADL